MSHRSRLSVAAWGVLALAAGAGLRAGTPATSPPEYRADTRQLLTRWWVSGPYPVTGRRWSGLSTDYLAAAGGEARAEPAPAVGGIAWRPATASGTGATGGVLRFDTLFSHTGAGVAYAAAILLADRPALAVLRLGTSDGVRVWCNDRLVAERRLEREIRRAADSLLLPLRAGRNRLLIKVENVTGVWGLHAELFRLIPRGEGPGLAIYDASASGLFIGAGSKLDQRLRLKLVNPGSAPLSGARLRLGEGAPIQLAGPGSLPPLAPLETRLVDVPIRLTGDANRLPESVRLEAIVTTRDGRSDTLPPDVAVRRRLDLRLPPVAGYLALTADLHCHTTYSDGQPTPEERIWEAWEDGLDALAITDHNNVDAYPLVKPLANRAGLLLIHGEEFNHSNYRRLGHVLALGMKPGTTVRHWTRDPENDEEVFRAIRRGGGLSIWAHPSVVGGGGRNDPTNVVADMKPSFRWAAERRLLHAVEIANNHVGQAWGVQQRYGTWFYPQVMGWHYRYGVAIVAVSDSHAPTRVWRTGGGHRYRTIVLARERSAAAVLDAIRERRTLAWFNHMLWGDRDWLKQACSHWLDLEDGRIVNRSAVPFLVRRAGSRESPLAVAPFGSVPAPRGAAGLPLAIEIANAFSEVDEHPVILLGSP